MRSTAAAPGTGARSEGVHRGSHHGQVSHGWGFVRGALGLLGAAGANCWLFGGWAEELQGLCPARPHEDVDLLYPAEDFTLVEPLFATRRVEEIERKRFAHKRAFMLGDVMVELFLVERDGSGFFTSFWGRSRHDWPADLLSSACGLPVASAAALTGYRARHGALAWSGCHTRTPVAPLPHR